ncbi:hypothetical protein [Streptomyces sp. NBC_01803]|uniref:hypothetical protein n=1 Tax=Streptomyces sp. NBC_01803 TaxID=2975946 RepID=UPI002DDC4480|nr:hypothetical protein [Streptomyces sp. NBC_01803]WSA44324.1 DUF4352 domain-containing protein [Streptomyces sp. NBC_01803]
MRFRAATVAAVMAVLLTATACDGSGGSGKRGRHGGGDDDPGSSGGGFDNDSDSDSGSDDLGDEPTGPTTTELTPGESYTWEEQGLTVTVGPAERYTGSDPVDPLVEGETPFTVDVTILNEGTEPVDLADVRFMAETPAGLTASPVGIAGAGFLEGTLAAGRTEEAVQAWSLDTAANGRAVVIEASWFASMDTPRWATTIP